MLSIKEHLYLGGTTSISFKLTTNKATEEKDYISFRETGPETCLEFRLKKSHVLIGAVINSKFNGPGGYFVRNGDRFSGTFKDEKKHGYGCYIWADGAKYEGEYK